jgi:ABC-2 type transport system ATP-binding protein
MQEMAVLEVKNFRKIYGKTEAVKGISFEVGEDEIFGLIGPNGAGKSTTLRAVATILRPTEGEIVIAGHNLVTESEKAREIMSYLPEEAGAYKNLSGKQYLEFMAQLFIDDPIKRAECLKFASDLSGLGGRLKDKVTTYSKGMTRKLLLARTVMTRPKLAILDEPTSGLDVINAMEIRKTVRDLAKQGMSVLLSSHNMLEIEFMCGRVGIIDKGIIYELGTPEDLKNKYKAKNLEEVFMTIAGHHDA